MQQITKVNTKDKAESENRTQLIQESNALKKQKLEIQQQELEIKRQETQARLLEAETAKTNASLLQKLLLKQRNLSKK